MTHAALTTIAGFLNTERGDLLLGVADDGTILGLEADRLDNDDKFMRHLAQVVRSGLGDRAGTCIDPKIQIVDGKAICVVSCQRSPEPVFLKWKGVETAPDGDFFVRSGPGPSSCRTRIRRNTSVPDLEGSKGTRFQQTASVHLPMCGSRPAHRDGFTRIRSLRSLVGTSRHWSV